MSIAVAETRPVEEQALFNPAFLAVIIRRAADEHEQRAAGRPLPAMLAYLAARWRSTGRRAGSCQPTSLRRWASGSGATPTR